MKKTLLTLCAAAMLSAPAISQTVIYDNGPLFDLAGAGAAGANVSSLHDGMGTYGLGHAVTSGFRVADDITISNGSWVIDSLVFFAYQTGSGNVSSIAGVNLNIWDGPPGDPGSTVVFGDGTTNLMIETDWSGTYRTGDFGSASCEPSTCTQRPIMRNSLVIGTTLPAGTYWLDWQTDGSLASGPWVPFVNLGSGVTSTGNSKQYDPTAMVWNDVTDGALTSEAQGLPFLVVGTILTGVNEITNNNSVTVSPNPMNDHATISINSPGAVGSLYSFVMYDILGNEVKRISNTADRKFTVTRDNLSKGVYFYEVLNGTSSMKKGKLIIQ